MPRALWACCFFVMACPPKEPTSPSVLVVDAGVVVVDAGVDAAPPMQVAVNRLAATTASGGPAIESEPLEPHDPTDWRVHLKAGFPAGRVEVGTRVPVFGETDDDQYFNGGEDLIRLVTKGRDVICPLPVSASCAKAPGVQTKGEFTLVCLPEDPRHDGCASSSFSVDWGRQCVLVDVARATCHRLPFVDVRFVSPTRLEVEQTFSRLPRMPKTLADVAGDTKLGCGSMLCKHCPPDNLVRLELDLVDGGLELHRVVGELTCGEQSCDRQTNAQLHPVDLGCHR